MHPDLENILDKAGRRLLAARTVESVAVTVSGGLVAAAWAQLAWLGPWAIVWPRALWAGLAVVVGGALCGTGTPGQLGWRRDQLRASGLAMAAVGLLGGLMLLAWGHRGVSSLWLPLSAVAIAVPMGAVQSWLSRPGRAELADWLDRRLGWDHRLATLAAAGDHASAPAMELVEAQTLARAGSADLGRIRLWRRGRATAASLALLAVVCLLLGAVGPRPNPPSPRARALAEAVGTLSAEDRNQLADVLASRARRVADPDQARRLAEMVRNVASRDPEQLARLLDELAAGHEDLSQWMAIEIQAAAGAGKATGQTLSGDPGEDPGEDDPAAPEPGPVLVYDPQADPAGPGRAFQPQASEAMIPASDAWTRAQKRAADALAGGAIRIEHRPIIRAYFRQADPFASQDPGGYKQGP